MIITTQYIDASCWENYSFEDGNVPKGTMPMGWHINNGVLYIGDSLIKSIFSFDLKDETDLYFFWKSGLGNNSKGSYAFIGPASVQKNCVNTTEWENEHYHFSSGKVKWRVINPNGGFGCIDNISIKHRDLACLSDSPILFINRTPIPEEGLSSLRPNAAVNRTNFEYIVDISTNLSFFEVALYTISPGCNKESSVCQGSRLFNGKKRLEWNNITLNCSTCGKSYYYFTAISNGNNIAESGIFEGPWLYSCILDTRRYPPKRINETYCEDSCSIKLIGSKKSNIFLSYLNKSGYWNRHGESRSYVNNGEQTCYWNNSLSLSDANTILGNVFEFYDA